MLRSLILLVALIPSLSQAKARLNIHDSPHDQQLYQYTQMIRTEYPKHKRPSYFWGGCLQVLGAFGAVVQVVDTFTNRTSEKARVRKVLPGGNMFHTLGVAGPMEFETTDGIVIEGMGRLSLGAPPMFGKFLPGFGLVLYEQGQQPVGIHAIHSLAPQTEVAFFANSFSNKLSADNLLVRVVRGVLSVFIRRPLHLDSQRLIERLRRAGSDTSRFENADHLVFRAPEGLREDPRFLRPGNDWVEEFGHLETLPDRLLLNVFVSVGGSEVLLGKVRVKDPMTMPLLASSYGNHRFHVPHLTQRPSTETSR